MRELIYDVAVSIDGFICRADGAIDDFAMDGPHVADYQARLATYDTVVMGRKTYEFGYQYGLEPGRRAYPHMEHYVVSSSLEFEHEHELNLVPDGAADLVRDLKHQTGSAIYLCGGGQLAGFLLREQLIDRLILKVNPILIGEGRPLFSSPIRARLQASSPTTTEWSSPTTT